MSKTLVERGIGHGGGSRGGGGAGVDGVGEMSNNSSADLSSPLSEPEPLQHSLSTVPSPSPQRGQDDDREDETRPHTTSTTKSDRRSIQHYSLTPPATTTTTKPTSHNATLKPPIELPPSLLASVAPDQKLKIKRASKKTRGADVDKDQPPKPARKRAAAGKGTAAATARKKAKSETAAIRAVSDGQCKISDPHPAATTTIITTTNGQSAPISTPSTDYPIRIHDPPRVDVYSTMPQPISQSSSPAPAPRLSYDPVRSMMVPTSSTSPKVYSTAPPSTTTILPESGRSAPSASPPSPFASRLQDSPTKPEPSQQQSHSDVSLGSAKHERAVAEDATASLSPNTNVNANSGSGSNAVTSSSSRVVSQVKKTSSTTSSTAPSPKPPRTKENPPALPQGSGLISSALFGSTGNDLATPLEPAPNVYVHVKLKARDNNIINFARLAEEKYGFAALHPRLAAQKARLARVAAAGAALEKSANGSKLGGTPAGDSGDDDLSVDVERESDNEGDVAMNGGNGGGTGPNSGTDGTGPKKRRKKKGEEYDQDDPFVDDTELAWEAQAAAVKDGFFVYNGPLVPEGEKATVERADGTVKRGRGRGRGGGPGSRGGRGAAAAAAAAAAAGGGGGPTSATANGEGSGGRVSGGPGSRGGATTRKPRVTKAGRANLDREKQEREKMAPLAAKPRVYPTPPRA